MLKSEKSFKLFDNSCNIFSVKEFFITYKYLILLSFSIGIFANLIAVSTPSYGFDSLDAIYEDYFRSFLYVNMRVTSALLYKIFPFLSLQGISQVVGIFILSLSATLLVHRLNISIVAKAIFTILIVTHPSWCHLIYFQHQFAYNTIGILSSVFAFVLLIDFTENKRGKEALIISIIALLIGIFSYQTILFIFAIISSFYALISFAERTDFKYSFKLLICATFVAVVSFILYLLIIDLFLGGFNNYQIGFLRQGSSIYDTIYNGVTVAFRQSISVGKFRYMHGLPASIFLVTFFIVYSIRFRKLKLVLSLSFFIFVFLVACFFFTIFFVTAIWSYIYLPIYFAVSCILGYIAFKSNIWKLFIIFIFAYILFMNIQYTTLNQQAQIIAIENDKMIASRIMNIIYNKYPEVYNGKKPIVFVGFLPKENRHPILENSHWHFNLTIFNHDQVGLFLKLFGLPTNVEVINSYGFVFEGLTSIYVNKAKERLDERFLEAKEIAKSMPAYPDRDSVRVEKDFVIVKLGEWKDI